MNECITNLNNVGIIQTSVSSLNCFTIHHLHPNFNVRYALHSMSLCIWWFMAIEYESWNIRTGTRFMYEILISEYSQFRFSFDGQWIAFNMLDHVNTIVCSIIILVIVWVSVCEYKIFPKHCLHGCVLWIIVPRKSLWHTKNINEKRKSCELKTPHMF